MDKHCRSQSLFMLSKYKVLIDNPEKLPTIQVSVSQSSRRENEFIRLVDIPQNNIYEIPNN